MLCIFYACSYLPLIHCNTFSGYVKGVFKLLSCQFATSTVIFSDCISMNILGIR